MESKIIVIRRLGDLCSASYRQLLAREALRIGKLPKKYVIYFNSVRQADRCLQFKTDWPYFLFTSPLTDRQHVQDGSILVRSDGRLNSPEVVSEFEDVNRFSFRLAGTTGRWNPARDPPRFIQSGDQANIYCHSVGLGPYRHISSPPAEASSVMLDSYSARHLSVPVTRIAFESPDRELIRQYDNGQLS